MNQQLIGTKPLRDYGPDEFAYYLRSIINDHAKRSRDKKAKMKARQAAYAQAKPKARPWSFRLSPKGNAVISIRGRKPAYLYEAELSELVGENPEQASLIHASIAKRKIEIKSGGASE
jgi:hypothetical protein